MSPDPDFSQFTADDILKAWLDALRTGLGDGRTIDPAITDLNGQAATGLRTRIQAELDRRRNSTQGPKGFDAAAFRASTRVARDLGTICAIIADSTADKKVTVDAFQRARALVALHGSCPTPDAIGGGPFC
jgi:hypothetical protein